MPYFWIARQRGRGRARARGRASDLELAGRQEVNDDTDEEDDEEPANDHHLESQILGALLAQQHVCVAE
jgi:hypothetical protein